MKAALPDPWLAGQPYERFMGRWSRPLARAFIEWLSPAPARRWLDIGCGTGALSEAILAHAAPASVLAVDPSPAFTAYAKQRLTDPRITFQVADALNLSVEPNAVHVAVAGLVFNFIPDPLAALQAISRILHPDGTIALYVWDYAGKMEMLRYFWDSVIALDPDAQALDEGVRFPICQPDALRQVCEEAGLHNVAISGLQVATAFSDFADYWSPFLGGQGPGPAYVARLSEAGRAGLAQRLRGTLPMREDGSIRLVARAWAMRATA